MSNKTDAPQAITISKTPPGLVLEWKDGFRQTVPFIILRKECPCAECRGELTPLDDPSMLPVAKPLGPNAAVCRQMYKVGGYAVGLKWGDGHNAGIYSWEYLRALAEAIALEQADENAIQH